jgi:predicted DNA-binding transcriptional regulator YafY
VRIVYERGDKMVERTVDPLGIVLKAGVWYLVGSTDGQIRTYRVSRVTSADVLETRFDRPDGFDLVSYWSESSAAYERDAPRAEFTIRIRPDRLDRLASVVGDRNVAAAERLSQADPEGWLRLRLRIGWPNEVPGQLLALGEDIEILEPEDLRARVIDLARDVVRRYAPASVA